MPVETIPTGVPPPLKRTILGAFAWSFGISAALIALSMLMLAIGILKQDVFGSLSIDLGGFGDRSVAALMAQDALAERLTFADVAWRTKDAKVQVTCTATNPGDQPVKTPITRRLVFWQGGKLAGVLDGFVEIDLAAKAEGGIEFIVLGHPPTAFDAIAVLRGR